MAVDAAGGADAATQVAREASALNMGNIQELWVYKAAADGTHRLAVAAP